MSEKGPQAAGRTPRQLIVREFIRPRDTPECDRKLALRPDIHVTRKAPPTFLLQAENDYVDGANQALVYYIALKNAEVSVEMTLLRNENGLRSLKSGYVKSSREKWLFLMASKY
jgi:hypothetical protein